MCFHSVCAPSRSMSPLRNMSSLRRVFLLFLVAGPLPFISPVLANSAILNWFGNLLNHTPTLERGVWLSTEGCSLVNYRNWLLKLPIRNRGGYG